MKAIIYGVPIILGFVCGYFLSLPVICLLTIVAISIASYLLWVTKDAELGVIVGFIAAIEAAIFLASLWVTTFVVSGWSIPINLHWVLR